MTALNRWQLAAAKVYGLGDYARVTTLEECHDVGDTLFTFIMIELSDKEGTSCFEDAIERMKSARRDIHAVMDALDEEERRI